MCEFQVLGVRVSIHPTMLRFSSHLSFLVQIKRVLVPRPASIDGQTPK